jgi:tripartite-type tricarboxylate transporter receptor subunit TctC
MIARRNVILCGMAFIIGVMALPTQALAQSFPNRSIRLVVTQAAGGAPDIIARLVAERMARGLGQSVVVENRAGGANVIGAQAVARAAPDGYTYLFATAAALVTNPHTFKSLPYDPAKDFVPVGMVGKNPFLIVVNSAVSAKTLADLVALDKREPGKLSFATDGPRNFSGMVAAWLNKIAGTDIAAVPYAAMPQGIQDTIAGRTQVTILAPAAAAPFIKRGDLRALAQTGAKRMSGYEEIPAVADSYPGFDFIGWFAIVAPTGTSTEAIQRMNQELDRTLKDAEVAQRLRAMGFIAEGAETPAATGEFIRAELQRWERVVREIGLQPE